MTDVRLMSFIIGFWLFLPIPFMFFGIGGANIINVDELSELEQPQAEPSTLESIGIFVKIAWTLFWTYVFTIFIWVEGCPLIINLFLMFLRLISGLILLMIARGN